MILGQLTRGLTWRDPENMTRLFKVYVRPHLEYAQSSWSPWTQADCNVLEQVQQRFTRQVSGMGGMSYQERLDKLGLTTLQDRRERGDVIKTYKILTGKVDVQPDTWFKPLMNREGAASTRATCGHLNLDRREANSEMRKNQFSVRVVPKWNDLPNQVKQQTTLNGFKNAYDDHKIKLTRT